MEKINVFIVHNGFQPYVQLMINQLESVAGNVNIVFLGNGASKYKYGHEIREYFDRANEFSKYYIHLSQQTQEFELICIQRWFAINEYMRKNHLTGPILHLDSDVLLFESPQKLFEIYSPLEVTMGLRWSPANSMFANKSVLDEFCSYIFELYKNNPAKIRQVYQEECVVNKNPNGISDMRLFQLWIKEKRPHYVDTGIIHTYEGVKYVCDVNFNMSNGFEMEGDFKKVFFIDNVPFFKNIETGERIRVCCMHFQGQAKMEMHKYKNSDVLLSNDYNEWHTKFVRVKRFSLFLEKIGIKSIIKKIVCKLK